MPWRPPSATCPCRRAGGASGSPPASRAGGGGRRARPSILRHHALARRSGGDGLLDLLLGLPGFLVALLLTLGHVRLLKTRHCEARSDEATYAFSLPQPGLLRYARNDGVATTPSPLLRGDIGLHLLL